MIDLRLAATFLRIAALNELQYRANFLFQLFDSLIALFTGLFGLWLVFDHTSTLAGWTPPELLAVMGVYLMMGGIIAATIQPNMEKLMGDVQEGTLDYVLTKPADAQVLISVREVRMWRSVDVGIGIIILVVAGVQLGEGLGLAQALAFIVALLLGGAMVYSFWLMLTCGAFWVTRVENIIELFQGVYQAGRWPVGIYPDWLRNGLTFLVPVAFAVTVPAEALTNRLTLETLAGAAALALFLLALSRLVWRLGLRRYSGASA